MLVTGASSGIGAAAARAVCAAGGRPVLLARSADKLDALVAQLGPPARAYVVDCADREAVAALAPQITADVGTPDAIVNNAGSGRWLFFDETEPEELEEMMRAPFFAAVYVTRAFLPAMIARGSGLIVNINAPIAYVPWQSAAGYGLSRSALRALGELLRADLSATGVKVSEIVSGLVSSEYIAHNPGVESALPGIARLVPVRTPEQVAAVILRTLERETRLVFTPALLRVFMASRHVAPGLLPWLSRRTGRRRPAVQAGGIGSPGVPADDERTR